jgi:hypothetical protein
VVGQRRATSLRNQAPRGKARCQLVAGSSSSLKVTKGASPARSPQRLQKPLWVLCGTLRPTVCPLQWAASRRLPHAVPCPRQQWHSTAGLRLQGAEATPGTPLTQWCVRSVTLSGPPCTIDAQRIKQWMARGMAWAGGCGVCVWGGGGSREGCRPRDQPGLDGWPSGPCQAAALAALPTAQGLIGFGRQHGPTPPNNHTLASLRTPKAAGGAQGHGTLLHLSGRLTNDISTTGDRKTGEVHTFLFCIFRSSWRLRLEAPVQEVQSKRPQGKAHASQHQHLPKRRAKGGGVEH